jgi:DNA-binding NarL/FixJ family response regulator
MRILLADDHEVVRRGMRVLLEARPGWQICDEAVDGRDAVEKAVRHKPDVVILDIGMPVLNGLEAARQIRKDVPESEVLILTMHESEQVVREVVEAGARGYVLKSDAGRALVKAVEALAQHKTFFTSRVADLAARALRANDRDGTAAETSVLTHREREVVQLLAEGRTNKDVAECLGISVRTVETHRNNIMRKLGGHTLSDLVRYAVRNNLVVP